MLFVLTCVSTFLAGTGLPDLLFHEDMPADLDLGTRMGVGLRYAACAMTILLCHEMGHYLQARRYGVRTSLPLFVPMPFGPIGTLGAVIGMRSNMGDRRALFDIGITGPLAGLVPTLVFLFVGLLWSKTQPIDVDDLRVGAPLIMSLFVQWWFDAIPPGYGIELHPMAFAGWFGLLITSLNLIPIGQLDGGHILYALLRRKAQYVASLLLALAIAAVMYATIYLQYPAWWLMVLILFIMGPQHPPTADDNVPLGPARIVLGWLTLGFVILGFTPRPF
ncbi:MAG: site-2 protease family protein [Pirellulales bacterium]|nr:site-2 protease family protein [Pirellulales bacterium]